MGSWNLAHVDPRAPGYGQMTTKWWLQTKMAAFLYLLGHVFLNTRDTPAQFHSSQGNQVSWGATFWSGVLTVECFLVTHQNVWFRKILAAVWQISRMSVFEGCWDRTKSSLTWSPQTKMADCLCDLGACFLLETFLWETCPPNFMLLRENWLYGLTFLKIPLMTMTQILADLALPFHLVVKSRKNLDKFSRSGCLWKTARHKNGK